MVLVLGELPHELVAPHAYTTRVVGIGAFSYQCYIHVPCLTIGNSGRQQHPGLCRVRPAYWALTTVHGCRPTPGFRTRNPLSFTLGPFLL